MGIPMRLGFRIFCAPRNGLLQKRNNFDVKPAFISSKAMKGDRSKTQPKPWPYREKGYNNLHAYYDKTSKRFDENTKVICVEGPVASGKTRFAKGLAEDLEMEYFPMGNMDAIYINAYGYDKRQLDSKLPRRLQSFDFNNFIQTPTDERATTMQFKLLTIRLSQYIDALAHVLNTGQGVVLDRTFYSDMVFVEAMYACGYMNQVARDYYFRLRDNILWEYTALMRPHLVVYLDSPVSVVESNLKKRGLGEEKTLNKKFLETMERVYKQQYLKSISEHAELLIYDWSEQGDPEVVVEDIERIDFDRFDIHDPKMEDWKLEHEDDWCHKRYLFTNGKETVMNTLIFPDLDVPETIYSGEEIDILDKVYEAAPGEQYMAGYNANMGDTGILMKTKRPRDVVKIPDREAVAK